MVTGIYILIFGIFFIALSIGNDSDEAYYAGWVIVVVAFLVLAKYFMGLIS